MPISKSASPSLTVVGGTRQPAKRGRGTTAAPRKKAAPRPPAAQKPQPAPLVDAVESGDYLAELKAMHLRIAKAVNNPNMAARDLAALSRRQLEISKEIQQLEAERKKDPVAVAGEVEDEEWGAAGS